MSVLSAALAAFAVAGTGSLANGAVLAEFNFQDTRTSSDTDTMSVTTDFVDGPNSLNGGNFFSGSGVSGKSILAFSDRTTDAAQSSIDDGRFFSFTLAPTAGNEINLGTLDYHTRVRINGAGNTSSFTSNTFLQVSTDGTNFSNVGGTSTKTQVGSGNTGFGLVSVDLSSFAPQTGTVTFRLFVFDNQDVGSTFDTSFDNVIVNGTVSAVPEPTALGLLGLGVVASLRRRRR
jgi:hypothetical protein